MQKLTRWIKALLPALLLLFMAGQARAVPQISIEPGYSTGSVGGSVVVELLWDGDGPNYIGDYDVNISFDPAIISFVGATFDFGVDSWGCFLCDASAAGGVLNIFEVSFDDVATLMDNQDSLGNAFLLTTIEFEGVSNGFSPLNLSVNAAGDEWGLPFEHETVSAGVCIGDPQRHCIDIPEPPVWTLILLPLLLLRLKSNK